MPRVDIISIGTLGRNRIWNETAIVRTAHATTSLIREGKQTILVDPGLPGIALGARLFERTALLPQQIDIVFLTNFRPAHRAGLSLFSRAKKLMNETEIAYTRQRLEALLEEAPPDDADRKLIVDELKLLATIEPADDKLSANVDLFPLPGYTPGTAGLLITAGPRATMIAGDAIPTLDHLLAEQVLPDAHDFGSAQESMREAAEIADLIVPGHDNVFTK